MATTDTHRLLTDYQVLYKKYQFIRTQQRSRPRGRGHNAQNLFGLCRHYLTSINQIWRYTRRQRANGRATEIYQFWDPYLL